MKKTVTYILSFLFSISWLSLLIWNTTVYSYFSLWDIKTIYTKNEWDAINTWLDEEREVSIGDVDPIRQWAHHIINAYSGDENSIAEWIVWNDKEISDHTTAVTSTLQIIKNIINWALWMLALVALIYILIQWFIMLTAAGDDAKLKKWWKWIKRACIAIAGIGLSWFIVTFIFWIIRGLAS